VNTFRFNDGDSATSMGTAADRITDLKLGDKIDLGLFSPSIVWQGTKTTATYTQTAGAVDAWVEKSPTQAGQYFLAVERDASGSAIDYVRIDNANIAPALLTSARSWGLSGTELTVIANSAPTITSTTSSSAVQRITLSGAGQVNTGVLSGTTISGEMTSGLKRTFG
jgi:hypothetical protein